MSKLWILGIDPGISGAVAVLDSDGCVRLLERTPLTPVITSGKVRNKLNIPVAKEWIKRAVTEATQNGCRLMVYLERVSSRPTDGGIQGFNFGRNFGHWEGLIAALELPNDTVAPPTWKAQMIQKTISVPRLKKAKTKAAKKTQNAIKYKATAARKQLSIEVANRLFPDQAVRLATSGDDGMAEALLIAEWGRRKELGVLEKVKSKKIVLDLPEITQELEVRPEPK